MHQYPQNSLNQFHNASPADLRNDAEKDILQRARQRLGGRTMQESPDQLPPWVHDSWVGECEAAGLYSRKAPAFDYDESPNITAALTAAEVQLLAQRHLNTAMAWEELFAWTGVCEGADRARIHDIRFQSLAGLLPLEDQQRFLRQAQIRRQYLKTVEAEVQRCEKAESEFWEQVDAGLVSELEIAAHKTPPFIAGLPVVPVPADGAPGPEQWDLFPSDR